MWDIFIKMLEHGISPNNCLMLYSLDQKINTPYVETEKAISQLFESGFILIKQQSGKNVISITDKGKALMEDLDSHFKVSKKKTNAQLMGENFSDNIETYRNTFPSIKLPSGKPARNNTKALGEAFKWFFETYDYTWEEIHKAASMYVAEYKENNYMYMMTSQYFISKQDKNKVKKSELADYCDMIREGVSTVSNHFKEKVV